jgi:hypothetical protein
MPSLRTRIGLCVLVVLVAVLGHRLWSRGMGLRLGAAPSAIAGPYKTEAQWAAATVLTDIAEMLRYARDRKTDPGGVEVEVTPAGAGFAARVTVGGRTVPIAIDGDHGVWSAAAYAPAATHLLRELGLSAAAPTGPGADAALTARLLDADAVSLERESERLGSLLGAQMLDATLHEDAALLVVAFSLREAAERISDDRPQLLRMVSHLAIARALRGDAAAGFAGGAASAYADHLAGRGRDAERALSALAATSTGAEAAWQRVLSTRIDDDWRRLDRPATFVERREAFRARLAAAGAMQAVSDLRALEPREADWGRLLRHQAQRVDAGDFVTAGYGQERDEIARVWRVTHASGAAPDPIAVLDGATIGAITPAGPRPLPWGLWSRFYERHLVAFAGRIDTYYRHSMSANGPAERIGGKLDVELGGLDLYPAATSFRTRGVANGDADLRLIDSAIRGAIRRPEILPAATWAWLEYGQQYEPVAKGMPPAAAWFAKPLPRVAGVELARRLDSVGHKLNSAELEALWREAPADYWLANVNLERRFGNKATPDQIRLLFGRRLEYDLRARRRLVDTIVDPAERIAIHEGNCAMDLQRCFDLAWALVEVGREADAAAVYERSIADERTSEMAVANFSRWYIDYLRRTGRVERARALADRAAQTGAARGVEARALLLERLDELEQAADDYEFLADRYDEPEHAIGFYYRMARGRKLAQFETRLQAALPAVFPNGLQPLGANEAGQAPAAAVQVTQDSPASRRYGIQAGDLIVGLDGWRVESLKQYQTVRAFTTDERMRLVLWRGVRLDVEARAENRRFNIGIRTYPIRGWAE